MSKYLHDDNKPCWSYKSLMFSPKTHELIMNDIPWPPLISLEMIMVH